jgi:hypothetical protein
MDTNIYNLLNPGLNRLASNKWLIINAYDNSLKPC